MDKLFLTILNMSITGAFVIAAICIARLLLSKAPKGISYCLWAVAGFRLVFPVSIESAFSLIPVNRQTIPLDIAMQAAPQIDSGIPFINSAVSSVLPAAMPMSSVNPLQIWTALGAYIWLLVAGSMAVYGVASFLLLNGRMKMATHISTNIYEDKRITTPFVLGLLRPKIYLPYGLCGQERDYIILHEQTHIRRKDHLVKLGAYLVLCVHWFNPLVWAAFLLMGTDMEMSCDERVLKQMGGEIKKEYSRSLLSLAAKGSAFSGTPLAFGESGIKQRIKNILRYQKPSRAMLAAAIALAVLLSLGFGASGTSSQTDIPAHTAMTQLLDSVRYEQGELSFQIPIPARYREVGNWSILIAGREEFDDGFSRSVHFFEEQNQQRAWTAGVRYSIQLDPGAFTELIMEASLTDEAGVILEKSIDLLSIIQEVSPDQAAKAYLLEGMSEKQQLERLSSISLYPDGTARLAEPPISSYILPHCTYAFVDNALLIYASIQSAEAQSAFGVEDGQIIARFAVTGEDTLVFQWAAVPLFADEGARYTAVTEALPVS